MKKLATWYEKSALTSDKLAFRYPWNCQDNPYDESSTADLNLLIVHVMGAAYALTKLEFGDTIADSGVDAPRRPHRVPREEGGGARERPSCPMSGFIGKCAVPANGKEGPEIRRWYTAKDAAYQQDFCVSTAKGVWSTTF